MLSIYFSEVYRKKIVITPDAMALISISYYNSASSKCLFKQYCFYLTQIIFPNLQNPGYFPAEEILR